MNVSRRELVGWLGAAAVLAPSLEAGAAPSTRGAIDREERDEPPAALISASSLLAPLAIGSQIGAWRIERFGGLHAGAVSVDLSDRRGERFHIDICLRDDSAGAAVPPARTDRCDLFVANEGAGSDPTDEEFGLAAMALAELVRAHEHRMDLGGLLTLRERLAHHGDEVRRRVEG